MAGKFLLDTNIIIVFSGERRVSDRLLEAEVFVPNITLGEL